MAMHRMRDGRRLASRIISCNIIMKTTEST
jgi:hypothetical protein